MPDAEICSQEIALKTLLIMTMWLMTNAMIMGVEKLYAWSPNSQHWQTMKLRYSGRASPIHTNYAAPQHQHFIQLPCFYIENHRPLEAAPVGLVMNHERPRRLYGPRALLARLSLPAHPSFEPWLPLPALRVSQLSELSKQHERQ